MSRLDILYDLISYNRKMLLISSYAFLFLQIFKLPYTIQATRKGILGIKFELFLIKTINKSLGHLKIDIQKKRIARLVFYAYCQKLSPTILFKYIFIYFFVNINLNFSHLFQQLFYTNRKNLSYIFSYLINLYHFDLYK